ncbi:hypothetical protein ACFPZ0_20450 [Streptomonospora nanhaiensis]|uniref:Uncharacterized protein n=1 Tax=Streptomonospora nanhaiensis TaxID=1323731 RepID=A0A853BFX7_9ACTN|nr:hypothetical protein [Streptomonospora nanhaiensis]MBV2363130.1 hypothetical protein [Streptomonospora nanhaiensis]MBX9390474.1 hypothetical protein [Streptomonospora nanhaiensis]NYI94378.1 hypothetical protein [Streptomonospora nanhaiensis]
MTPAENGDRSARNTRHPLGVRITAGLLGVLCLVLGPVGYIRAISAGSESAAEWYTLGFSVSVGLPLLAAAITTVAGDRRAALWSLALLGWPVVYVVAIHLAAG